MATQAMEMVTRLGREDGPNMATQGARAIKPFDGDFAVSVESVQMSRVLSLTIAGLHFEDVMAAEDPDTGVISLRIACQTHPLARWRRIGPRLIRFNYGEPAVAPLMQALETVIARIEAEFKRQT